MDSEKEFNPNKEQPNKEQPSIEAEEKTEAVISSELKEAEITEEIVEFFKNDLFINKENLKNVNGFSSLSEGQQLLVLENIKQISLGRIEKEALSEQRKKQKTFKSKDGKFWENITGHLKAFSQNIWTNGIKNFAGKEVAELEKLKVKEMEKGGMEAYGVVLKQLVDGMIDEKTGKVKDDVPEIEKIVIPRKKGEYKLEVKYLAVSDSIDEGQKKLFENFNQSASEFSKIPDQWSDKTAKIIEREKYKNAKRKYEKARGEIMQIKAEKLGDKKALLEMNEIDYKLQMNQFLNSHSDIEKQIQNIKNKSAWKRAMKSMFMERGFQFSAGFAARTATIALGGVAGLSVAITAPAAVLGLGAHRAMKSGKKSLDGGYELSRRTAEESSGQEGIEEREFLKKYADIKKKIEKLKKNISEVQKAEDKKKDQEEIEKYSNELKILDKQEAKRLLVKKDYVDAKYLSDSFETLIDELKDEKLSEAKKNRKEEMIKSLIFQINTAQEKLNDKAVNFGGDDEFLPNQYQFIRKLSEAEAFVNTHKIFNDIDEKKIIKEDLEGVDGKNGIKELVYNIQNAKFSKAKRNYLLGKAGIGVATSALFFYAGSRIRDCVGDYIHDSSVKNIINERISKDNSDVTDGDTRTIKEVTMPGQEEAELQKPKVDITAGEKKEIIIEGLDTNNDGLCADAKKETEEYVLESFSALNEKEIAELSENIEAIEDAEDIADQDIKVEIWNNEKIKNYIAGIIKDYKICETDKEFEDFNQDEIIKLAIVVKDKGETKNWKMIKNFLKAEMDKPDNSDERYIFALKADNLLYNNDESSLEKVAELRKEIGLNKEQSENLSQLKQEVGTEELSKESGAEDAINKSEEAKKSFGLKNNFNLELGKGKIPQQLERVFSMIAADSMKDILGDDEKFSEEEGSKILNVAANLVSLSEGNNTAGIKSDSLKDILSWDEKSQKLEIKNFQEFNKLVENLHSHADKLWTKEVLQKGATAYLDDIKTETWKDIIHAEGLEKVGEIETGLEGHDNITPNQIIDFKDKDSEIVKTAEAFRPVESKITESSRTSGGTEIVDIKDFKNFNLEDRVKSLDELNSRQSELVNSINQANKAGNKDSADNLIGERNEITSYIVEQSKEHRRLFIDKLKENGINRNVAERVFSLTNKGRDEKLFSFLTEEMKNSQLSNIMRDIPDENQARIFNLIIQNSLSPEIIVDNPKIAVIFAEINIDNIRGNCDQIINAMDVDMKDENILLIGKILAGDNNEKSIRSLFGVEAGKIKFSPPSHRIILELNESNKRLFIDYGQQNIGIESMQAEKKGLISIFKKSNHKPGFIGELNDDNLKIIKNMLSGNKSEWVTKKKIL